jgi:peroxiredoxin Q/BCP
MQDFYDPKVGDVAPDFRLPSTRGRELTLKQNRGKDVILYFYPKDDTPGCTAQACALRDSDPDFAMLDAVVLGVSADTVASHKKFAQKYGLSFPLLADVDKRVVHAYGVWGKKKMMGREYEGIRRTSFLIAPDGKIAKVYENVKASEHAAMVLADLTELTKENP